MSSIEPESRDDFTEIPPPRPTTPPVRRGFLWVLLLLTLLTAVVYGVPYMLDQIGYAYENGRARAASEALAKLDQGGTLARASELFRLATHAVSPAVVHIRTQSFGKSGGMNLGSGVVIDRDRGLIVTNQHVVRDADLIVIRAGRTEMNGEIVGQDPKTDLAVVRVKGSLPMAARWADSEKLEAGDWVLAIGSPFGLERTVSAGIVSATSRNNLGVVAADAYEDFIQTDVAINPGNSGGPLVDLQGHVVGINTAISMVAPDQGNQGIGFAISSALARRVVDQLIKSGKVVRAYLGIVPQPITARPGQAAQPARGERGLHRRPPARGPGRQGGPEDRRRHHRDRRQARCRPVEPPEPDVHPGSRVGHPDHLHPGGGPSRPPTCPLPRCRPIRSSPTSGSASRTRPARPSGASRSTGSSRGPRPPRRDCPPASGSSPSARDDSPPRLSSTT